MIVKNKTITVNEKGMITIPYQLRKKYNLSKGSEVAVIEIEGNITVIPLMTKEEFEASRVTSASEMEKVLDQITEEELELEN
ncbi:MAG TPA: AbrB/MazE/SpoVT family DNA-binding domain-containing protein [Candidatus Lokiarchaeia archaeon]|nr:AbrB/MazE/SpoVT family DNA-binding domain-containing protein [Candidatus Lokiarchaeia archaeon]